MQCYIKRELLSEESGVTWILLHVTIAIRVHSVKKTFSRDIAACPVDLTASVVLAVTQHREDRTGTRYS